MTTTENPITESFVITDEPPGDTAPSVKRARRTAKSNTQQDNANSTVITPPYQPGVIANGLTGLYGKIGIVVGSFDPHCGQAFVAIAEESAKAWERYAKESPAARRVLHRLLKGSAVQEIVAAHIPLILAFGVHHVPAVRNRVTGVMERMMNIPSQEEGSQQG